MKKLRRSIKIFPMNIEQIIQDATVLKRVEVQNREDGTRYVDVEMIDHKKLQEIISIENELLNFPKEL